MFLLGNFRFKSQKGKKLVKNEIAIKPNLKSIVIVLVYSNGMP